jgi:hypothetical protein
MKKILFVCDGANFSTGAFEFVKMLNDHGKVSVKGIFVEPIDFQQLLSVSYVPIAKPYVELKNKEQQIVEQSRQKFKNLCENCGISYSLDKENVEWGNGSFAKETRFADMVVISEELFCADILNDQPNAFMQEALHVAECPVVLVPENFKSLERIIVAYDGGTQSMFALKQFCQLLPELFEKPAEIVYSKKEETDEMPDLNLLKEYSRNHFNNVAISKLHFNSDKYFATWCEEKKNGILVAGSYSRSAISNLIKKSFAQKIIHEHKMPVFLAHP